MISKLKLWAAGLAFVASLLIGAFLAGGVNGKNAAKAASAKRDLESLRKVREIEKAADSKSIADVRKRIASRLRD